jgi:Ca-activated chloride channel family protein
MRRPPIRGAWLAAAMAGVLTCAPGAEATRTEAQDPPQPTFQSSASAVAVDVTVRDRSRRPVTGLTANDFQVFDNGVLQKVDEVSYGKLPIDVTVALDVSYSVTGALLERLRRGVSQLMGDLTKQDRLKLVLFNMRVNRTLDFTNDVKAVDRAIRGAAAGGGTALFDAVSVTLVSAHAPDRRQLIVFFTDGSDSVSTTTSAAVSEIAKRTRATLTFVMPGIGPTITRGAGMEVTPLFQGGRGVMPGPRQRVLSALAGETGGTVLPVSPTTDLSAAFRRVLNEFRTAYVLYYTVQGVERAGYHTIEVTVNREGADVQARRGYFGS